MEKEFDKIKELIKELQKLDPVRDREFLAIIFVLVARHNSKKTGCK